ncbi:MAG: hypothetical protein KKB30_11750 [Proteobacteria bacterium]|nr:hypothetical protein [Pseudomonadota bacterium]MBU1715870.1 hypothetical protein [Pseudomonadota bacterium]
MVKVRGGFILLQGMILCCCVVLFAVSGTWADQIERLEFDLNGGYRVDQLDWNIADFDGNPDILSELAWNDLTIYQIGTRGKLTMSNEHWWFATSLRGVADYGLVTAGDNQDSDYNGDNRTLEFSRSNNSSKEGEVYDLSVGVGTQFPPQGRNFIVTPMVGYSYHRQNLTMTDGYQTVASHPQTQPEGIIVGLDSTYDSIWKGPWAGLELEYFMTKKFMIRFNGEWHRAEFRGLADWNLRSDLQHPISFRHRAEAGTGLVGDLSMGYAFNDKWALNLTYVYQKWQVENGTIRFYMSAGGTQEQPLNEVNWESYSGMLGVTRLF